MNIELTTSPSAQDAEIISQGLVTFNRNAVKGINVNEQGLQFFVFARDGHSNIVGGLRATCFWNTMHIELVWVSGDARGNGIGSVLVEKAERFAVEKGFELALLETTNWQAKPFYDKLGYELLATLPDYPKGYAMHFLTKRLAK